MPIAKSTNYAWLVEALKGDIGNDCLIWPFCKNTYGYGSVKTPDKRFLVVHRVAFFLTHARWPAPIAMHTCDNRACFNPNHIIEGTNDENMADMVAKGRASRGERNVGAKLTEQDIKFIRSAYSTKQYSRTELAGRFGVTPVNINHICSRRTWKYF